MITIYFNEVTHSIKTQTLEEFLSVILKDGQRNHFAVAINHQVIPRTLHDRIFLSEGDTVDVIVPMQGG